MRPRPSASAQMASLLLWAAAVHAQQDEAPPLLESKSSVLPPSGPFMFENADYTYHQGTFDVHFNDTVGTNHTMTDNRIFETAALERSFWEVITKWEAESTDRAGVPVLGVGRGRVFHSLMVASLRHKWRETLTMEDLEVYKGLGVRTARIAFQWSEPEVNWEQLGLQYLYMEYLQETKRLNAGIKPRANMSDPLSAANPEYMQSVKFADFVSDERYTSAHDASSAAPRSRPAGGIYPTVNYTHFAPDLDSPLHLKLGRGNFFPAIKLAPKKLIVEKKVEVKLDSNSSNESGVDDNTTNTTDAAPMLSVVELEEKRKGQEALVNLCKCVGPMPPNSVCKSAVSWACAMYPGLKFCAPCIARMVDTYDTKGQCLVAMQHYTKAECQAAWGDPASTAPGEGLLSSLPRPIWMESWKIAWYQQRNQWWDAQRKQYRPQVWAMVDLLAKKGIYASLDFRPQFTAGSSYCGPDGKLPVSAEPRTDMWICFVPERSWIRP